jgi:hypothetical protein
MPSTGPNLQGGSGPRLGFLKADYLASAERWERVADEIERRVNLNGRSLNGRSVNGKSE